MHSCHIEPTVSIALIKQIMNRRSGIGGACEFVECCNLIEEIFAASEKFFLDPGQTKNKSVRPNASGTHS